MCDFLLGVVNKSVNQTELNNILGNSKYHFLTGSKEELLNSVLEESLEYTFSDYGNGFCNCGTAFGSHYLLSNEIDDFLKIIKKISKLHNIEYLYIIKNIDGEKIIEQEEKIYFEELDFQYLSEMKSNCLYCIDLRKRFY